MPGYFWRSFSPSRKRPGKAVGIHDGDWWELVQLVTDLCDAADDALPLADGLAIPTRRQVDRLPAFDPEQVLLLGEDPDWKRYGPEESEVGPARWCTPATLARYVKAMRSLDACIPQSRRQEWQRYLDSITGLVAKKQGLYCSTDE